jgi:hypothetical protein
MADAGRSRCASGISRGDRVGDEGRFGPAQHVGHDKNHAGHDTADIDGDRHGYNADAAAITAGTGGSGDHLSAPGGVTGTDTGAAATSADL